MGDVIEFKPCANSLENKIAKGRIPKCSCGKVGKLNERYDSYYCEDCDTWLEPVCSDPNCQYCNKRPENQARFEMDKHEAFESALQKLDTDNGISEDEYLKLLETLTPQQKEKIKEKVDYSENNTGKLGFFLYEEDVINLRKWAIKNR